MTIHVVRSGETIDTIAEKYGLSSDRLIIENGIEDPARLVVGEAIVILHPMTIHTIRKGDTLEGIADRYGVTVFQILRNNPYLSDRKYIYPGETIVISYKENKIRGIETNGFAYPFIDMNILQRTLPFLTYLTVYKYEITAEGNINDIEDTKIIQIAKMYHVVPVMMITVRSQDIEEEVSVIHSILSSEEKQERIFNHILRILQTKGYCGVSINTSYILPADRNLYEELVIKFADALTNAGYKVYNTFSINIFNLLTGTIYDFNYNNLYEAVDGVTIIRYLFGYSQGLPLGTISMDTLRRFGEYLVASMSAEKLNIGLPVIGYIWKFPYDPASSKGMAVSYDSALNIAFNNNAEIQYDETTNTAYFQYISDNDYVVRFWDARSIESFVKFVSDFGLNGTSVWNIMNWFPQLWMIINSQYEIHKLL